MEEPAPRDLNMQRHNPAITRYFGAGYLCVISYTVNEKIFMRTVLPGRTGNNVESIQSDGSHVPTDFKIHPIEVRFCAKNLGFLKDALSNVQKPHQIFILLGI